jgi:hypothetical protein
VSESGIKDGRCLNSYMESIIAIVAFMAFTVGCVIYNYISGMKAGVEQMIEFMIEKKILELVETDNGELELVATSKNKKKL